MTAILFFSLVLTCITPAMAKLAPDAALLAHLFKYYNVNARPSLSVNAAVNLSYDIALRQMLDLDEKQQIMTTNVWIRHYWNDPFLVWEPRNWSGVTFLAVNPDIIWKPDITLYNNAEREFQGFDDFGKTRVNIYSSGLIVWLVPMILRSECKMSMRYFPFDAQYCPLKFGSWAYDSGALDFHPRNPKGDMSSFSPSGEFTIVGLEANRVSTLYKCCPNPYVTITYTVRLKRRVKFYLFNLIIPGILISLLSVFSFFLPPLSGERIGLIITNFLSLSVYVLMVSDSIPPSSESIPLLVKFYTVMISEIAISLILNCIIIPVAAKKTPVPVLVRKLFIDFLAPLILCRRKNRNGQNQRQNTSEKTRGKTNKKLFTDSISNDNFIYENRNGEMKSHANSARNGHYKNTESFQEELVAKLTRIKQKSSFETEALQYLKFIADSFYEDSEMKNISDEWDVIADILDRLFFFFFLVAICISTIVLVMEAPEINL